MGSKRGEEICACPRMLKREGGGKRESCGEWGLQSGAGKVLLGHVSQNGGTSHSGHFGEDTGLGY